MSREFIVRTGIPGSRKSCELYQDMALKSQRYVVAYGGSEDWKLLLDIFANG